MAGTLWTGGPGQILRAVEKDESYLTSLTQRLSSLSLELAGPEVWVRHRQQDSLQSSDKHHSIYTVLPICDYLKLNINKKTQR